MIAKLRGRVDSIGEDWAVIDTGGVGYLVFCSARTLAGLPGVGEAAELWVETHVREDHIHLYGFAAPSERDWFRLLQTVQGVGARMALSILSLFEAEALATVVAAQDRAALTRANGVGPKIAGRILAELKDKVGIIAAPAPAPAIGDGVPAPSGATDDAVSALVNLGYGRAEAFSAVSVAARGLGETGDLPALIRAGLKELSP